VSNNSNKEKLISQAQKLVEKGQFDKAIREYLKVVSEDENDIRIWIRIGDLYVKLGQKAEAVENYKKVAQLYVQQGDPEKAIAVYKRVLEISPQATEANLALGALYREQSRIGHATQQYELAAQSLYRAGKIRDSLRAEQAIVDMSPDSIARRIKLAELYSKENMYSDAAREFSAAAAFLHSSGRLEDYAKVAERLLFHAPQSLEAIKELSRYYLKSGDAVRALTRLQGGFKVDSKDPEILELLAETFLVLGKNDKSVAVFKELARIYTERGALAAARSIYQRVATIDTNDADAKSALQSGVPRTPQSTSGPLQEKLFNSPMPQTMPSGTTGAGGTPLPSMLPSARVPALAGTLFTPPAGSPLSAMSGRMTPSPGSTISTRLTPAAGSMVSGKLTPPIGSTISARLTPAAGMQIAPVPVEEEAARLVAEADSFLRFGLAKKAVEHLQSALQRDASLRPVRERLVKLYEAQRDYKLAITELRTLLSQCSDPQEEVHYLREILRLDNQDQEAHKRLTVITGLHRLPPPSSLDDDFDEPEISVSSGDDIARQAASALSSDLASTSEVPVSEFKKYLEKMKGGGSSAEHAPAGQAASDKAAQPASPQTPAPRAPSGRRMAMPLPASDGVPEPMPSADTRPNAAEVEAAAEELALTSGTLKEELDEVDFCLQQKMYGDARRQLQALLARYPHSKTVQAKLKQLENPASEVVIDVDMADVHEELLLSNSAAIAAPPPPAAPPQSGRSLSLGVANQLPQSGRSLPPEFAQSSPSGRSQTASQRSIPASQRSLPPPPPRPSRQMKTIASSDASGAFRVGVAYRNRGAYEQAIAEFEKAMGDAKRGARAALMMGLCYRDQNRIKEAIESFKLGIHMQEVQDTDLTELFYQLGRSFELLSDAKEAIHFYQQAIRKEGRFRDSVDRIATLQKSLDKK